MITVCYGIIHILTPSAYDLTNLNPSLPMGAAPLLKVASASSQALPAPKPNPTQAGHALRLNRRTEKTTPKESPKVDRIRREDIVWSHLSLSNASLTGFEGRAAGGGVDGGVSAIVEAAVGRLPDERRKPSCASAKSWSSGDQGQVVGAD